MSRPALFSHEGALRVLGKYDRPWLEKTDTFLGVSILVSGAIEPSIFSLLNPKNEATGCLGKIPTEEDKAAMDRLRALAR